MSEPVTIFDKIIAREIPADVVYEDEDCLAFHDIQPQAPVHVLVIPKRRIENVASLQHGDLEIGGKLLLAVGEVARLLNLSQTGYRVVANCGADGGQSVDHLHLHVLGGRPMKWPPG